MRYVRIVHIKYTNVLRLWNRFKKYGKKTLRNRLSWAWAGLKLIETYIRMLNVLILFWNPWPKEKSSKLFFFCLIFKSNIFDLIYDYCFHTHWPKEKWNKLKFFCFHFLCIVEFENSIFWQRLHTALHALIALFLIATTIIITSNDFCSNKNRQQFLFSCFTQTITYLESIFDRPKKNNDLVMNFATH